MLQVQEAEERVCWAGGDIPCGEGFVILVVPRRSQDSPGEKPADQACNACWITHLLCYFRQFALLLFASSSEEVWTYWMSPSPRGPLALTNALLVQD